MKYQVTLGFNRTSVEAESRLDAVAKARKAFCAMWPDHTFDIMRKPVEAFEVYGEEEEQIGCTGGEA